MRLILSLLITMLWIPATIIAQDDKASQILDKLSAKTKAYNTISADFSFTLVDKVSDVEQTQEGNIVLKDDKFNLLLGDNRIISNGETQWTYNKLDNEVYIDNPSSGSDGMMNPSNLFTVWETGFKHYYEKQVQEDGKTLDVIKLVPKEPADKSFHTIMMYVDQSAMQIEKVKVLGKQGENFIYDVKKFEPNVSVTASTFTFEESEYPGVSSIDNR